MDATKEVAVSEARKAEAKRDLYQGLALACNGDPGCVSTVAQQATMSGILPDRSAVTQVPQYAPKRPFWQELLGTTVNNLSQQLIPGAVNWRQSDNSTRLGIAQSGDQRAILTGAVQAVGDTAQGFVNAPWLNTPSYTYNVGQNMSQGPMNIGDQTDVGGDQVAGNQHHGSWELNRENTATDLGGGIIGDGNRQDSDDDYSDRSDRSDNSGQCQGNTCQGTRRDGG